MMTVSFCSRDRMQNLPSSEQKLRTQERCVAQTELGSVRDDYKLR